MCSSFEVILKIGLHILANGEVTTIWCFIWGESLPSTAYSCPRSSFHPFPACSCSQISILEAHRELWTLCRTAGWSGLHRGENRGEEGWLFPELLGTWFAIQSRPLCAALFDPSGWQQYCFPVWPAHPLPPQHFRQHPEALCGGKTGLRTHRHEAGLWELSAGT